MRKLLRSIAHYNAKLIGMQNPNKPIRAKKGLIVPSRFAETWRTLVKGRFEVKKGTNTLVPVKTKKQKKKARA